MPTDYSHLFAPPEKSTLIRGDLFRAIMQIAEPTRDREWLIRFHAPEQVATETVPLPSGELWKLEVHSLPAVAQINRLRGYLQVYMLLPGVGLTPPLTVPVIVEAFCCGALRRMPAPDEDGVLRSPRRTWHLNKTERTA
jgi:hypothetical protein